MEKEFYSNGKLLVSGEYAVLDGALAWGLPTKFGQYLRVQENELSGIQWKSLDEKGTVWFSAVLDTITFDVISTSDYEIAETLMTILKTVRQLNSDFLKDDKGYTIQTELTFPRDWGLGTSSTLINNIANWSSIDAYELLKRSFGGSGYDIANAQHDTPILYHLENGIPNIQEVARYPTFKDKLYFVYLNKKKNSREGIAAYKKRVIDKNSLNEQITKLTNDMAICQDFEVFKSLITKHETILSKALGITTVKEELFSDYLGSIKSLGAWGGDFILVTAIDNTTEYFREKGYQTILPFREMIL